MGKNTELKIGDIAICNKKYVGIITDKKAVHDGSGVIKWIYKGINIKPPHNKWQSKNPIFVTNLEKIAYTQVLKILLEMELIGECNKCSCGNKRKTQ